MGLVIVSSKVVGTQRSKGGVGKATEFFRKAEVSSKSYRPTVPGRQDSGCCIGSAFERGGAWWAGGDGSPAQSV